MTQSKDHRSLATEFKDIETGKNVEDFKSLPVKVINDIKDDRGDQNKISLRPERKTQLQRKSQQNGWENQQQRSPVSKLRLWGVCGRVGNQNLDEPNRSQSGKHHEQT